MREYHRYYQANFTGIINYNNKQDKSNILKASTTLRALLSLLIETLMLSEPRMASLTAVDRWRCLPNLRRRLTERLHGVLHSTQGIEGLPLSNQKHTQLQKKLGTFRSNCTSTECMCFDMISRCRLCCMCVERRSSVVGIHE